MHCTLIDVDARRDARVSLIALTGYRSELNCQSIAGPIDNVIGLLIADQMTPAAVELTLEIWKEMEVRYEEAPCRANERAQKHRSGSRPSPLHVGRSR